jgi:chlorophyllide a reductase subunit Z
LWKGPQIDWFATTNIGIVASGTYVDGFTAFLGDELGMPVTFASSRPLRPGQLDNEGVRQLLHKSPPAFVFGSINEKIYLSEAGAKYTNFVPASFPGPIVRRAVGTPFMGYRGAVYLLQEIVNRLYEVLFNFLPVDAAYGKAPLNGAANGAPKAANNKPGNLPWQAEAKAALDTALDKLPFLPRISASREIQMQAELAAHEAGLEQVTAELIQTVLASRKN